MKIERTFTTETSFETLFTLFIEMELQDILSTLYNNSEESHLVGTPNKEES